MIIGCPKEIKEYEFRVALIPDSVRMLTDLGHTVLIENNAGVGCGISNEDFIKAKASIVSSASEVWQRSDMIVKVKEPLASEYDYFKPKQILFTFLHLAAEENLTRELLSKKVTAIAYETIEDNNTLPILKPMSEVAGRMSVQIGAHLLTSHQKGKGLLLGGVPGVRNAQVTILGAGSVGKNAAKMALGLGASVTMLDINPYKLEEMDDLFLGQVRTVYSNHSNIANSVALADLLIGAVLISGAKAPCLVSKDLVKTMNKGSVIVDVAIDQGGCIETIRRTTHDNPTYVIDDVVHYGVANMPGAVALTSTYALSYASFPYLKLLASSSLEGLINKNHSIKTGLNCFNGELLNAAVAQAYKK